MYLTGLSRKNSIMDNALVPDQATDWSITLKPGSYTGDTKLERNSAEFTFAKSSGIVTKDREKDWPIVDRCDPSNNPRNNRGSNFFSNKIPFSFLKRRITQLKTALFSWVKGKGLSYAFYPRFRKKFPRLSNSAENIQVISGGCRMTQCPFPQADRDTRHFVPLTGIFWVEIEYKFFSLMVYDKSFGILSQASTFSIFHDCAMN